MDGQQNFKISMRNDDTVLGKLSTVSYLFIHRTISRYRIREPSLNVIAKNLLEQEIIGLREMF